MVRLACSAAPAVFAVLVSASSFAVEVGALPESEFADTEVSTNVALAAGAADESFAAELTEAGFGLSVR